MRLIQVFGLVFLFSCSVTVFSIYRLSSFSNSSSIGLLKSFSRPNGIDNLHVCTPGKRMPSNESSRGAYDIITYYQVANDNYFGYCNETVTYTTQGDVTFLDNLVPLSAIWDGPISFAIYSPGSDFQVAVKSIAYLRQCHPNVRNKVNFHLVLDAGLNNIQWPLKNDDIDFTDCNHQPAPWLSLLPPNKTYRQLHQLKYPINVLRNVARMNAETYYVLASDIELYPSANLVRLFMEMMQRRLRQRMSNKKVVFVLPPFEVFANQTVPTTKIQLVIYIINFKIIYR